LDASELTALIKLRCFNNKLTVLNVSGLQNLDLINCSGNQFLKELDVGGLPRLNDLQCADSGLTKLHLRGARSLSTVWCIRNKLSELDAGDLPELTKLQCDNNELTRLNVAGSTKLERLICFFNKLEELDVSDLPELTLLACSGNKLKNLNAAGAIKLRNLGCNDNELSTLAVDALPELTRLECDKNRLTTLIVKGSMKLEFLNCSSNALTSLDLSGLDRLGQANCEDNPLTSLVIDENLKARPIFLSMQKGESLKLVSSMQWRAAGPLYAESVPGGTLITAWRGMGEREMTPHVVSTADRNSLFIKTRSDGTDILALGRSMVYLKEGKAPGKNGEALVLEMSRPLNQEALETSDFKLESGASVLFGSSGFESAGTVSIPLKVGYQTLYVIVSNKVAQCRYQIEVFREEEPTRPINNRRREQGSHITSPR
jgi:Leucine-rich repeat (LRR) protein